MRKKQKDVSPKGQKLRVWADKNEKKVKDVSPKGLKRSIWTDKE